jgi:hypothetical protein
MKQYLTVRQLAEKYPAFPQGGVRHLIFNCETNGFHKVISRVGRKILISEQDFIDWIENQKGGLK